VIFFLSAVAIHGTLHAGNIQKEAVPPYQSNGFFVSYYMDEFYGIAELEEMQNFYACAVLDLTRESGLCDTTWVLQWWEPIDHGELDMAQVIEDFETLPEITVTPNYQYRVEWSPEDPVIEVQTPYINPNDSLFPLQWHMQQDQINMPYVWKKTMGSPEVVIGIIDTGVWSDHEDLQANLWINPGEDLNGDGIIQAEEVNGIDDDDNGYPDDFVGWDWVDDDNDPRHPVDDFEYHGTKVIGVASATTNNHLGVAGAGWNCTYMPLRSGVGGGLWIQYIVPAMLYSIQQNVDVLNCSWYNYYGNPVLEKLTECLYDSGTVVVCAAGNDGRDDVAYPAGYECAVAVAATEQDKSLAPFSNYGDWIHIAAPGEDILTTSTWPDSLGEFVSIYSDPDGTSFSAPLVSGVAALIKTLRPEWTSGQIIQRLYNTTDPINVGDDPPGHSIDGGMLNAYKAVNIPDIVVVPEEAGVIE